MKDFSEIKSNQSLRKRKIWTDYITEREALIKTEGPVIDYSKWDGYAPAAVNYREAYNKAWKILEGKLIEINDKYIPLFKMGKQKCPTCKAVNFPENTVTAYFFCNDDCKEAFKNLPEKEQEKRLKRINKIPKDIEEVKQEPIVRQETFDDITQRERNNIYRV